MEGKPQIFHGKRRNTETSEKRFVPPGQRFTVVLNCNLTDYSYYTIFESQNSNKIFIAIYLTII